MVSGLVTLCLEVFGGIAGRFRGGGGATSFGFGLERGGAGSCVVEFSAGLPVSVIVALVALGGL